MTKLEEELEIIYSGLDEVMLANELSCEWDKRKKCDSLYIEENNKLKKKIAKAIEYIEQEEWNTEFDKKLLEILKGEK